MTASTWKALSSHSVKIPGSPVHTPRGYYVKLPHSLHGYHSCIYCDSNSAASEMLLQKYAYINVYRTSEQACGGGGGGCLVAAAAAVVVVVVVVVGRGGAVVTAVV